MELPITNKTIDENGKIIYTIAHDGPRPYTDAAARTVDKIVPCICILHTSTDDSTTNHGMPVLIPENSRNPGKHVWTAQCPKCHRSTKPYRSPYQALKHWNESMTNEYFARNRVADLIEIMDEDFNDSPEAVTDRANE